MLSGAILPNTICKCMSEGVTITTKWIIRRNLSIYYLYWNMFYSHSSLSPKTSLDQLESKLSMNHECDSMQIRSRLYLAIGHCSSEPRLIAMFSSIGRTHEKQWMWKYTIFTFKWCLSIQMCFVIWTRTNLHHILVTGPPTQTRPVVNLEEKCTSNLPMSNTCVIFKVKALSVAADAH